MHRIFPLDNDNARLAYNIQEVEIVGQVARVVPRIYAATRGPPDKSPVNRA